MQTLLKLRSPGRVSGQSSNGTSLRKQKLGTAVAVVLEPMESRLMMSAFAYTGAVQTYTVPLTGVYDVTAAGAEGGGAYSDGSGAAGLGAVLSGQVMLTAGTKLDVVTGGQGGEGEYSGGGGGGSFVYAPGASQPLLAAGGGGGGWAGTPFNALTGPNGGTGGTGAGAGGVNGSGGKGGASGSGDGGGGAGWSSAGTGSAESGSGGSGGLSQPGFAGGASSSNNQSPYNGFGTGGFGGGGGGGGSPFVVGSASGGGGGYSGGGGGKGGNYNNELLAGQGGGGGSYISPSLTNTTAAVTESGNGTVNFVFQASVSTATQTRIGEVGLGISDKATVFGVTPTGTVTFKLYDNPNATGMPLYTNTANVSGGVAVSGYYGVANPGTYYWVGTYNADSNNTAAISSSGSDPVVVTSGPGDWMAAEPDGAKLTDISLPGTVNSAAGPSLQDALIGSGSSNVLVPTTVSGITANDASLAAHLADSIAVEAALASGDAGAVAANSVVVGLDAAAFAADTASGITQTSTGAGLALGLTSDIAAIAADSAGLAQSKLSEGTTDPGDATAAADDTAVQSADTTAAADHDTAAADDTAAAGPDGAAGGADLTAETTDAAAGLADGTAGGEDATAAGDDSAALTADVTAEAQDGIDPVADFVAAGFDATATGADATAGSGNIAADVADITADGSNSAAIGLDDAVGGVNSTASGADLAANGSDAAAETANSKAATAYATAATNHTAAAVAAALSASANSTGAASDAETANFYQSFAQGMSNPDTTGNNSNNVADQMTVHSDAAAEASTHSLAAGLETVAAIADTSTAHLHSVAAAADTAAASALLEADTLDAAAEEANATAAADDATATMDDAIAAQLDEKATSENSLAAGADTGAEIVDITAAVDNGITAGADTAAGAADTAAIALDAIAAATAEIIFVDIGTAAAAAAGEAAAIALDEVSVGADTTDIAVDGAATGVDAAAAPLDESAAIEDALVAAADEKAVEADAAAVAADGQATIADEAAGKADSAAATECKAADDANTAANESNDNVDTPANQASTAASAQAGLADIAFTIELTTLQNHETTEQTQTLSIADQLNTGVRSMDFRAGQVNDTINLNAGQDFTGYTLQGALNEMTSFLQSEPTETIVVSLGNETSPVNSSNSFNADLNTLLNSPDTAVPGTNYSDFIYYSSNSATTPSLGAARGKIVFVPSADNSWAPDDTTNSTTGLQLGWTPTEVDQNSHTITDSNTRWNYAENDNGANDNGLIPTDLGNPSTLYRNNLNQDFEPDMVNGSVAYPNSAVPVGLGDNVDGIAQQYFTSTQVSRTTGIVGMDDPTVTQNQDTTANLGDGTTVDETLINAIIDQNTSPILVTSDADAPGAAGTLRDAIQLANSKTGLQNIEFAPSLSGSTGNVIILQSDLPVVTNDMVFAGPVVVDTNGYQGFVPAASHTVSETDDVASDNGAVTATTSIVSTPVYLDTSGITITTVAPVLVDPINITYGTALANSQLQGIALATVGSNLVTIPGTFTFTGAAGITLHGGQGQIEAVTFTPANLMQYAPKSTTVVVNVAKIAPVIGSVSPISITYGTALTNSQLSGTITDGQNALPGTLVYTSATGSIPHAGSGQSEQVTFMPADPTDYAAAFSTVKLNVAQATPSVTVTPVNIIPGTALAGGQLGGTVTSTFDGSTVNIPGIFTYTTNAGVVLNAGIGQIENVTFTPDDTTDYSTVASSVIVNVAQTSPVTSTVSLNPVNITYGTALANDQLTGTATYPIGGTPTTISGTFAYTTAAGLLLSAGIGQSEAVTFTPADSANYAPVSTTVTVNVAQATPTVASLSPINIPYGTALANTQLNGSASYMVNGNTVTVPGTFSYASVGSVPGAGNGQSEAVTFTPNDTADYATASSTVTANVAQATPTVTSVNAVSLTYGTALANAQLTGTATYTLNGTTVPVPGTFSYTTAAGTLLNAGNGQSVAVTFTPNDTADFATASSTVTLNVAQATPTVIVNDSGGAVSGSTFAATGTVTGIGGITLGSPTFSYYAATDTTFAHPLSGAPSALGRYVAVGSYPANGNYSVGATETGFAIYTPPGPINPSIITAAQPATATLGSSIADKVTVTGSNPTGVVTFKLYNNSAATAPALFTDVEPLTGGIATSKGFTTTAAALGTDYWVATYCGDAANNPATTTNTADPVTVVGSLFVNSTSDSPTATGNTLRDAITYANTLGAGTHTITFDPTVFASAQTITLSSTLTLSDTSGTTIITGPAAGVTLSGGNSVGLFDVKAGVTATFSQLSLVNGKSNVGGAIVDQGTLTITNSTLTGNTSVGPGGAIVVTGSLTVENSTLASNSTAGSGGAIENLGTLTVLDSTLSTNQANNGSGGAIDNGGNASSLTIQDSIFAGNAAGSGPNITNAVTSLGNNLIGATDGSTGWVSSDLTGTLANPLNPMLASLANNGGPTQTMVLLSNSPAIGAGAPISGITTDQRGLGRPANSPDIGAYQTEAVVSVTDAGGTYNGNPFPATAASATGTFGLHDTNLADFTFSYAGTGSTSYPASSIAPSAGGTYTVTATYLGNATHASSSSLPTPFTIIGGASTTTVTDVGGTYNGNPFPATAANATGAGGLSDTNLADFTFSYAGTGSTTYAASSTAPTNVGTYTVIATYKGDATHIGSSSLPTSFAILKAASTTTVTDVGGTYNGSPFPATTANAKGAGGLNDTTLADFTFSYAGTGSTTYAASSTAPTNAGTYTVTATYTGDANHNASSASAPFTIAQATPTISVTDNGGVYTGSPFVATGSTSIGTPYFEYFLQSDTTFSHPSTTAPTNVGSYVAIGFSPANSNYVQVGKAVYFSITPAPVIVAAIDAGGTYNGLPFAATGTVTGVGGLSTTPTFSYLGTGSTTYAASSTAPTNAGTYSVTAAYTGDTNHTNGSSGAIAFTITAAHTSVALSSSAASGVNYGQSVKLTAVVSAIAPGGGTPVGSVQFFSNGASLGIVALVNGSASITTSSLSLGTDAITATYLPSTTNFTTSTAAFSQPVTAGIVLLDKTGSGALTVSGSAKVVAGSNAIVVDSNSSTAINVSGIGSVTAGLTNVVGGAYVQPYSASVSNLHTGQASAADPLASLATPTTSGLTVRITSTMTVAGNSVVTLQPGLYIGGININGAAKVTLAPGEYYLQGGGLNVGGSATLTGTGVFIFNAPTKPTDQINFNGAGSVSLSPMTTGTWAGMTIFQARASTNGIFVSGIGTLNVTGTIYAASAAITISGAGAIDTFGNSLIADDLNVSGIGELLV